MVLSDNTDLDLDKFETKTNIEHLEVIMHGGACLGVWPNYFSNYFLKIN